MKSIYGETLAVVMDNFHRRLQMLLDAQGLRTEYVFARIINSTLTCCMTANSKVLGQYLKIKTFETDRIFLMTL